MRVVEYNSIPAKAGETKTVRTFGAWLGDKPANLSKAVMLKPQFSANLLLDGLMNVYEKDTTVRDFEPLPSMNFTWMVNTDRLVKVRFAADCTDNGQGKRDVRIILDRKYYDKNDTFRLKNGQLLFVRFTPKKLSENQWEHIITLVTNNPDMKIDTRFMSKGSESMYISNYFPELSERGYSKWTFNAEKHINYISRHRQSDSFSGDYAAMKRIYYQTGKGNKAEVLELPEADKRLMDQLLQSRAGSLLFAVSNFDVNGKCLDKEEDGRDIPMGDGIITQFARYCDKFSYNDANLSVNDLDDVLYSVVEKTGKETGNIVTILCNRRLYRTIGRILANEARLWAPNAEGYYLNKNGDKIKVGAHFDAYTRQGNSIMFKVDETLSEFYSERGYGICLDTGITEKGMPNISLVTLKGRGIISGTLLGMGGTDGNTSGNIATSVDGSEYHVMGYGGAAVQNPYGAIIMMESIYS